MKWSDVVLTFSTVCSGVIIVYSTLKARVVVCSMLQPYALFSTVQCGRVLCGLVMQIDCCIATQEATHALALATSTST
jgi:hypothetical protein